MPETLLSPETCTPNHRFGDRSPSVGEAVGTNVSECCMGVSPSPVRNSGQVSKKSPAVCCYAGRDRGSVFLCYAPDRRCFHQLLFQLVLYVHQLHFCCLTLLSAFLLDLHEIVQGGDELIIGVLQCLDVPRFLSRSLSRSPLLTGGASLRFS